MRRLVTLTLITAAALGATAALVTAADKQHDHTAIAAGLAPPTVKLTHPRRLPAPSAGTFVSLIPSCACNNRTALVQFALLDGH